MIRIALACLEKYLHDNRLTLHTFAHVDSEVVPWACYKKFKSLLKSYQYS